MGEWIRNEYKVNLVFYRVMVSAPQSMFYLNTQGIRDWQKSVVIRGVYNQQGSGRGCGRGHGGCGRRAPAAQEVEAEKAHST